MSHKVWISVLVILTSFIMSNMDNQEDVLQKVLSSDEYSRIFYNEKKRKQKERKNEKRKEKRQMLSESQCSTTCHNLIPPRLHVVIGICGVGSGNCAQENPVGVLL